MLDPGLKNEFNYAEVATQTGILLSEPTAIAIDVFLKLKFGRGFPPRLTQKVITDLVKVKHTSLLLRTVADILAWAKSPQDAYASCCRSSLCHAVQGSYEWAFYPLQVAASKNDDWARHHHIYGLIHRANGNFDRALFELGKANHAEPLPDVRIRITEAIALAQSA